MTIFSIIFSKLSSQSGRLAYIFCPYVLDFYFVLLKDNLWKDWKWFGLSQILSLKVKVKYLLIDYNFKIYHRIWNTVICTNLKKKKLSYLIYLENLGIFFKSLFQMIFFFLYYREIFCLVLCWWNILPKHS